MLATSGGRRQFDAVAPAPHGADSRSRTKRVNGMGSCRLALRLRLRHLARRCDHLMLLRTDLEVHAASVPLPSRGGAVQAGAGWGTTSGADRQGGVLWFTDVGSGEN